jgi:hypothetical protein
VNFTHEWGGPISVPFDMAPAIGFAGDKNFDWKQISAHPEIVDFGSGQGLSVFATTGIVCLFRGLQKSENAALGHPPEADRMDTI